MRPRELRDILKDGRVCFTFLHDLFQVLKPRSARVLLALSSACGLGRYQKERSTSRSTTLLGDASTWPEAAAASRRALSGEVGVLSSSTGWALMAGMVKVRSGVRVAMGDTGVSELEAMFGIYCLQVFAGVRAQVSGS